jgi:hypothetical protein
MIFQLQHDDKIIEGEKVWSQYVTNYDKESFSTPSSNSFTLDEMRLDDINQVTEEENNLLIRPLTEEEVREAVFQI